MKRLLSIFLAVCMAMLGSSALIACNGRDGATNGGVQRYYLYNAEADVLDKTEYLEIDGNKCSLVKDNDGIIVTSSGTITFTNNSFTVTCANELLGINITNLMSGERESRGVLRVDSQTVIGMTSTPVTDYEVTYYCSDGVKPLSPTVQYTVTFDGNGGKFDGDTHKTVKTNGSGTVTLPNAPYRSGYDFDGYFMSKTSTDEPVTATTVFERSMTVYAQWTERNGSAQRYYYYDDYAEELDANDYIELDGANVSMVAVSGGTTIRNSGVVAFSGNNFTVTIQRAFLGMDYTMVMRGERETNGVLRFTETVITGDGIEEIDDTVFYYCPNGVLPASPIVSDKEYEITFDASPGYFPDSTQTKTIRTDSSGKLKLPDDPDRAGYHFKGFSNYYFDGYITADTVFTRSMTLKATYVRYYNVEFRVENVKFDFREVEEGQPLGKYKIPDIPEGKNYHMFKGWHEKNLYKYYVATTPVDKNLVLVAEFYSSNDGSGYMDTMWNWSKPGHLYVHYLKTYGEEYSCDAEMSEVNNMYGTAYEDWMLWAWPNGGEGRAYAPIRVGMYGVVYDIDMKKTYNDGGWNTITKTDKGLSVNYYGKDMGIMFFNDKSRQNGDAFWENDGGNLMLKKSLLFDYWDTDDYGNSVSEAKYLFDENVSVHLLFMREYIGQSYINNRELAMLIYFHDDHVVAF